MEQLDIEIFEFIAYSWATCRRFFYCIWTL